MTLLSWRCLWSRWKSRRRTWQAWNHNRNEVLRIAKYPNPVFNEMWFLTIDRFVGISVFIAKLSRRQYCWRVIEDFHCQENIWFFDINCGLFMRLHFTIGCYDCRWTSRRRQSIQFSRMLIMCIDAPESTTNPLSSCQASTYFPKVSRMLFWCFSFNFMIFLANLHAASQAHRSCHSVSSWDRS